MIKKWAEFIKEDLDMDNTSYLDTKMQEIKDMLANIADGKTLIYEWENKNDHELSISFTTDELSIKYEFDIDDLTVSKVVGDTVDFTSDVESVDKGIEIIQNDIHSILGIEENNIFESKYEEPILITIEGDYIKNRHVDIEINRKLMKILDKKFGLNFGELLEKHKIDKSKVYEISKFLTSIGLTKKETTIGDRVKLTFNGKLTLKDIKKFK
jgi:hypothetical protein